MDKELKKDVSVLVRMQLEYEKNMDALRDRYRETPAGYKTQTERDLAAQRIRLCSDAYHASFNETVTAGLIPDQGVFIGREKELKTIETLLRNGSRIVLISGMGGIGKTALLGSYGARHAAEYDQVLYLSAQPDLKSVVLDDTELVVSGMRWDQRRYRSRKAYFREKLDAVGRLAQNRKLLLMLDDVGAFNRQEMEWMLGIHADILMTSRLTETSFEGLPPPVRPAMIRLDALRDEQELDELAIQLKPDMSPADWESYRKYRTETDCHTLALKLWLTRDGTGDGYTGNIEDIILRNEASGYPRKQALMAMALLPAAGTSLEWLKKTGDFLADAFRGLIGCSLVQRKAQENGPDLISLHPLIAEIVNKQLRPDMKKCRRFLENVAADVGNAWNEPRQVNMTKDAAILSILKNLPDFDAGMTDILNPLITFLWVEGYFSQAEKYALKLFRKVKQVCGEPHELTGETALKMAAVYHNSMQFRKAEEWYLRGYRNLKESSFQDERYHILMAAASNKCFRLHYAHGDMDKAVPFLLEAEKESEEAVREGGSAESILERTYIYRKLALVYLKTGERGKADQYLFRMQEGMKRYFKEHGVDPPRENDIREIRVEFLISDGRYREAVELLEQNRQVFTGYRGEFHEDTLHCLEQLGDCMMALKDPAQAREYYLGELKGLRLHYPFETAWTDRVLGKIQSI